MSYKVVLSEQAERDLRDAYAWYAAQSPTAAVRWYDGMVAAIGSLALRPTRCPLAAESHLFPVELRQLNYGSGRRLTHRIVFVVDAACVTVYAIRHLARQEVTPEQLGL